MQLRSCGLCSEERGEKQRKCSRAAPALWSLGHAGYLHISPTRGNHWKWLLHPSPYIVLGQEWYPTIQVWIFMLLPVTESCPRRLFLSPAGWVCSASLSFRSSPEAACNTHWLSAVLPSFHLQLFKTCLLKSHFLLVNTKCYLPQQSEISHIFPQTLLIKMLKGYLQVATTFCNWIPSTFLLLSNIATGWL